MGNLTHWKKTCNINYLGSWDLESELGYGTIILTIKSITEEEVVNPKTKEKTQETVCHFVEDNYKPMILNSTNKEAIAKSLGNPFIENWINQKISIHVEKVKAFGDVFDALRVSKNPVVVAMKKCECCGKEITEEIFNGTKAKCGFGVCSAACRDELVEELKNAK